MIREFQRDDINKVADIWLDTNIKAHNFIPAEYWKSNFKSVKEALLLAEVYVYEYDTEIQGFIGLNDEYVEGIFVSGEMQSQGIGKILLNYATAIGKFHGFELLVEKNFLDINYMVLRGKTEYKVELSTSPVGSMVKLENLFNGLHENIDFLEKKIEQYQNDLEASMPSYKTKQVDEQGKPIYQDVCYPVTKDFREKLYNEIISEYEKAKDKSNEKARESAEKHHGNPDKEKDKEATPFR